MVRSCDVSVATTSFYASAMCSHSYTVRKCLATNALLAMLFSMQVLFFLAVVARILHVLYALAKTLLGPHSLVPDKVQVCSTGPNALLVLMHIVIFNNYISQKVFPDICAFFV